MKPIKQDSSLSSFPLYRTHTHIHILYIYFSTKKKNILYIYIIYKHGYMGHVSGYFLLSIIRTC